MNKVLTRQTGETVTDKEVYIVQLLANGMRSREIGLKTGKSQRTIEATLDRLRLKTGCKSLPELVATFFRNKLIE